MPSPMLEQVFKLSGIPTYTFVKPAEYQKLLVCLRTPSRGLVVEGPSGIGKTTCITKALEDLGQGGATKLTARKPSDCEMIAALPNLKDIGTVIIDDFHRLPDSLRAMIADYLKTLADEEPSNCKLVVIGINRAGDGLIRFAKDLNNRIDTIRLEANSRVTLLELVSKGEEALNISINTRETIAEEAHGSFHLAQMLCHELCLLGGVTEAQTKSVEVSVSFEVVRDRVLMELNRVFFDTARKFASGPRLRRQGRAPYLHLLYWLSEDEEWSLFIDQAVARNPDQKGSVSQIVEKGYLENFLRDNVKDFGEVIHFDSGTHVLSIEDPKFVFFLKNLGWSKFSKKIGFLSAEFKSRYDFALSFAGADRDVAEAIFIKLTEAQVEVFYDKNEQSRILAANVEDYLAPIYRSEAEFVVVLLGAEYPKKIWTKFESQQFKSRFGQGCVIPVWFKDVPRGMFDVTAEVGGVEFDRKNALDDQVDGFCELLLAKLADARAASHDSLDSPEDG